MTESSMTLYNQARQALALASSLDEVKDVRDKAEALRLYSKQIGENLEMQNNLAEIKIRAERRAGELLAEMDVRPGNPQLSHDVTIAPRLSDLGIGRMQSSRWQSIARIPEDAFEREIATIKSHGKELTSAGMLQASRRLAQPEKTHTPEMPPHKFRVFLADPPWAYGNTMPDYMGVQDDHYPTMSMGELCALPIKTLAEDNAVLFLWVTSPILHDCFALIEAWGFDYKASFVWDKVKHVMGHYNSVRHELLLVCVRGSCQPDVHKLFDSVVTEERTEHSRKPETFRQIIDTIYPIGRRIELFAREQHEGWDTYGNEV